MESPSIDRGPEGGPFFACRGSACDNGMRCISAGSCQYKSSADEARAVMAQTLKDNNFVFVPHGGSYSAGVEETSKPSNPKDAIGSNKLPLHLWPATATAMGCLGMLNGMLKYGRSNFREIGVRASIYVDACKRHLDAWFEGEECDPDDGVPHLAAALSCLAIIVDARAAGKMTDDRNVKGGYRGLVGELTAHVPRLKQLHAGKDPHHYTIADNEEEL